VGIMPSYSGGISAMLRLDRVFIEGDTARAQVEADKEDGELVRVVGRIPYDSIVAVDRDGDSHHAGPHIYCHFDFDHGPYEQVLLYREHGEGIWLPIEGIKYRPRGVSLWRGLLWHRSHGGSSGNSSANALSGSHGKNRGSARPRRNDAR